MGCTAAGNSLGFDSPAGTGSLERRDGLVIFAHRVVVGCSNLLGHMHSFAGEHK